MPPGAQKRRYEGIDQRIVDLFVDEEISIGDYVLSGGEPAAIVLMDAIARQRPGIVKEADSVENDSFFDGLLDHPHYTRPAEFNKRKVPEILLSGDHGKIARWRMKMKLVETLTKRPGYLYPVNSLSQHHTMHPGRWAWISNHSCLRQCIVLLYY